jgi:hypothetical protein
MDLLLAVEEPSDPGRSTSRTAVILPVALAAGLLLACAVALTGCARPSPTPDQDAPATLPPTVTVRPTPTDLVDVVIANPGKGWLLFDRAEDLYDRPEILQLGTVGYARFNWKDVEPAEGAFDRSVIEDRITAWAEVGKQFAFRVMAANTHAGEGEAGRWVTPPWIFDAGAISRTYRIYPADPYGGLPGEKIVPVWNDPVFEEKVQNLVAALAERYDGDPRIAFIDVGTYGNWGEQHTWPFGGIELEPEELEKHISWYRDAFTRTQVINVVGAGKYSGVYYWCVENGIGLRRDGVLGDSPHGDEVAIAYDVEPGVFEWHRSYVDMVAGGHWSRDAFWKSLYTGRPSYQGTYWTNDAVEMYEDEAPLMREAANRLGYHLVLVEATFPATLGNGHPSTITLKWTNEGVAPVYLPLAVKLALLDESDGVLQTTVLDVDPHDWKPKDRGQEVYVESAGFSFDHHASASALAIGLFTDPALAGPDVRLGIEGQLAGNWYPLETR